jgi:hypothetical protein
MCNLHYIIILLSYCMMKTFKPYPSKTTTVTPTATYININTNTSTDAPDHHGGDGAVLPPVPKIHQSLKNSQGEYAPWSLGSSTTVGCLHTGTQSFGFQDPDSFLVAKNCTDTNYENPISDNCGCEVNVPVSPFGNPERCRSCSFVDSVDRKWRLAYGCSDLLSVDCVGRDTSNNSISRLRINATSELRRAVDDYLADNSADSVVASIYG